MLQAAANTAPRGVYVCGNTSTAAGLTVSCNIMCVHTVSIALYRPRSNILKIKDFH